MHFIVVPKNVEISWGNDYIKVTGPLGTLIKKKGNFFLALKESTLYFWSEDVTFNEDTYFAFLRNLIYGVSQGFRRKLRLIGVGYRVSFQGAQIALKIGYSHEILYNIPEDIQIFCAKAKGTLLIIKGVENYRVSQIAAEIRNLRAPDVYKGKGIHNENEILRLKKGKREGK